MYMRAFIMAVLRFIGYLWALPLTIFGFILATGGRSAFLNSDDEWCFHYVALEGGLMMKFFSTFDFGAFTCGAVICYRDKSLQNNKHLVRHEKEHFYQCRRWGLLQPIIYYTHSGILLLQGRNPYWDNLFEVAARESEKDI